MSTERKYWQFIKKGVVKTILWSTAAVFLLLLLTIAALQHPYVQTKVVQKLSGSISEKIGFPVHINQVNIKWFDILVLEQVEIRDFNNNQMIFVDQLSVDFNLQSLLNASDINLDVVNLNKARINLIRNTDDEDLNINLFIERIRELASSKSLSSKRKKTPVFSIDEVYLSDAYFSLNDPLEDSIRNRFDHYHFDVKNIDAAIRDFKIIADTVELDVQKMTGFNEVNDFNLNELQTFFRLSASGIEFLNLKLSAGQSLIQDSVIFLYDDIRDMNTFNDSVNIVARLKNSVIHTHDVGIFAPELMNFDDFYNISGNFDGLVTKFTMKDFRLHFGNKSSLDGVISFDGLPEIQETFMEIKLNNSNVHASDIKEYISESDFEKIKKFGQVKFNGQFLGFPNDFVANGTFLTDLGRVVSDINLKLEPDNDKSTYQGNLAAFGFDLGTLTERQDLVHKIDMNGNINGKGFTLESADLNLNANINKIGIYGYNYQNIVTNARFAKELFVGELTINDPNLKFSADASIDLRNQKNDFKIKAKLDTAILKPLNFSKEDAFISTNIKLDIQGNNVDDIVGEANFYNSYISYKEKGLHIDYLMLTSQKEQENRQISLTSDLVSLFAEGNFDYSLLADDVTRLLKEYELNFLNEEEDILSYYKKKSIKNLNRYNLSYSVRLTDINPLLSLFVDDLYIGNNTTIEGDFTSGYTSIFSLRSNWDTLIYKNNEFLNNELDLTSSKIADSTNVLASVYLNSQSQKLSTLAKLGNLTFEGVWSDDHIDFQGYVQQPGTTNMANIHGSLEFLSDRTEIIFNNSELTVLDKPWQIQEDNRIIFDDGEIIFENLKVFYENQNIAVNGVLSDSLNKTLTVSIHEFQLEMLNPLIQQKFSGTIDGYLDIKNGLGDFMLESRLGISTFKVDKFLVGDISGSSTWDKELDRLDLALDVFRVDRKTIDISGTYTPAEAGNQLDLTATFDQANLNIVEPFTEEIFTNIAGITSGEFKISGTLSSPILKGNGIIQGGRFTINYLNTHYSFNGNVLFDQNEIGVRGLNVYDDNNNLAILNGGVFHDGFKNFIIDLRSDMNNFKVLNTTARDNDLYYGTAIVTGRLDILGDINNLNFNAYATSNKGTKIFIPISGTGEVEQKEFINFVNFKDTISLKSKNGEDRVNLNGMKMNFDLDITPDAYCEIIFDIKSGDIIRGRGVGRLKLQIDTKGDFNMFGDYEIQEGGYNFTLYNIINKEFKIQSGSKITWYGDPYHAILDLNASYEQLASLYPLLNNPVENNESSQNTTLKRRYPAKVYLKLTGDLLAPDMNFDVDIVNYPENETTADGVSLRDLVSAFKFRIQSDRTELERQVFSLIILRRFSSENTFNTSGAIGNSVSELLSNQLSYWVTQFDENLEIDVDLGSLDADAFNTFQLRLAYTFLDGRLRVSRDGGFTNVRNEADISSIAGEWTLEYLLTPDGKFRAKMYNRNNYMAFNTALEHAANTTAGFSLMHIASFDKLKELFQKTRSQNINVQPGDENEEEEKQLPAPDPEIIIKNKNEENEEVDVKNKKKASIH
ncbi:translocation/assembly module TamB domain-containing protein [soil metagenome]